MLCSLTGIPRKQSEEANVNSFRTRLLRLAAGSCLLSASTLAGAAQLAPYFYTWGYGNTSYAVTSLMDARGKMGLGAATLAFVVDAGGCTVDNSISQMQSDISAFQSAGGRVIISFGGANGTYLEGSCSATQMTNVIDVMLQQTGVRAIDFDVEGGQLGNSALNTTRNAVIKALKVKYPSLYVSLTLPSVPVHPSWGGGGLDIYGQAAVQSAATAGANIDIVNLMTMDFGGSYHNGSTMAQLCESAAGAAIVQLAAIYPSKTNAQLWAMLGITPMIGNNDIAGETFTTADATEITQYAQQHGVGHLAFWALQRDRPGSGSLGEYSQVPQTLYQFYNTLKAATGTVQPGPATLTLAGAYTGDASKITTQPNIAVQAACSASGTKTATFKPPAGATISGLTGGETCALSETALSGAVLASGYSLSAPGAATFSPASSVFLLNGSNSATVTNAVNGGGTGGNCAAAWNAATAYNGAAQVSENNISYTANWWTQGDEPATHSGPVGSGQPWTSNGACGGTTTTPATLVFTNAYAANGSQVSAQPSLTVQAVCATSGTKTVSFTPPATGTISGLVSGESCSFSETAITGGTLNAGYTLGAASAASFSPASPKTLAAGSNPETVTNTVNATTQPAASLVFTNSYGANSAKVTTHPSLTIKAVCATSGTKTVSFTPPATGTISGLVSGESCALSETAQTGAVIATGYSIAAASAATFAPSASPTLAANANAVTVTNLVSATTTGGNCAAAWNASTAYNGAAQVSENNVNYVANWWTQGDEPATHNGPTGSGQPWTSQGACGGTTTPASLVFTNAYAANGTQVTAQPSLTVQAVCATSGTKTVSFTPPATGTISGLIAGESCNFSETGLAGGSVNSGYVFGAASGASFSPASPKTLAAGANAETVTNSVNTSSGTAASLVFTNSYGANASQVTTNPSLTIRAVCATSGTKTVSFTPPATGSITGLVSGESCALSETAQTGAVIKAGYAIAAASSASFTPSSNPLLAGGSNAVTVINAVNSTTTSARQVGSYFAQWGVYGRAYKVKNIETSGTAAKLTFINYAFNNIYAQGDGTYKCQGNISRLEPATSGSFDVNNPANGTGGDAWADMQMSYDAASSVDGVADVWNTPVRGSFGQFKKLKALHPNLKVIMSLGGWSWSRYFSAAAATAAGRQALVSSCVDMYINGNYPADSGSATGGPGSIKGIFDGIDIDWEYPSVQGIGYNTVSAADKHNFTLLMAEFRSQLDAAGSRDGRHYYLTAAIGAGKDKIDQTEPAQYNASMDWVNVMTYDYRGGWQATGPTNFHANLFPDPASPDHADPVTSKYNTDDAISALIAAGMPNSKMQIGIPFYGRGWTGVPGSNGGLYQSATGPAHGTYEAGIEDYKVLKSFNGGATTTNPVTQQSFAYDGTTFWSYDTPADIAAKVTYMRSRALGGVFSWSLDGDDAAGTLATAMAHAKD